MLSFCWKFLTLLTVVGFVVESNPIANPSKTVNWAHLINKRSSNTPKEEQQQAVGKNLLKSVDLVKEKSNHKIDINRNLDEDIDEENENERTIDWGLLDGNSQELKEALALRRRRRRRSTVIQTSNNANRQRSRTASTRQGANHNARQRTGRALANAYRPRRIRVKRAVYYGDGDGAVQRMSEADLQQLAYLVAEMDALNADVAPARQYVDASDNAYADDAYTYYPTGADTGAGRLSPENAAMLADWWRAQQRRLVDADKDAGDGRGRYSPTFGKRAALINDVDNDEEEAEEAIPVKIILLKPSRDFDQDDEDDAADDVRDWQDEYSLRNNYARFPLDTANDDVTGPSYVYEPLNLPTYYTYGSEPAEPEEYRTRRANEAELERRIVSLANFLNRQSKRR